ncbi:uncharacterized protein FFB20_04585 [Fusarium fujikuroi]|nr:uncharacterized protein FFB20_04585 [Fusarium fujikuroi]
MNEAKADAGVHTTAIANVLVVGLARGSLRAETF